MIQKNNPTKKIIATILIVGFLLGPTGVARAGYWGENFPAAIMKEALEEAFTALKAIILQTVKQAAAEAIAERVEKLLSGTTEEAPVIGNYQDFIFGTAQRTTDTFLNDFFRTLQQGGKSPETRAQLRMVEDAIRNEISPKFEDPKLDYYVQSENPRRDIFDQTVGGGIDAYMALQFGDFEHPVDVFMNTLERAESVYNSTAETQTAKSVAGGGFDTIVSGDNIKPGSVMKDLLVAAESMPMNIVSNATNWQEVIASVAVGAISGFIKNGIKTVSRPIESKIRRIRREFEDGVRGIQDQIYKGLQ